MFRVIIIPLLLCALIQPLWATDKNYRDYLRSTPHLINVRKELLWSSDSSGFSRRKSRLQRAGLHLYLFSRLLPVALIEFNQPDQAPPFRISSATTRIVGLGGNFIYASQAEKELRRQEQSARQEYSDWPLRPETLNDTLQEVEALIHSGFRVHAEPLKLGFRKTTYTLRGVPLLLNSTSAKVAKEQAVLLQSESQKLFARSQRLRSAYTLTLITTVAVTATVGIYEKKRGHRKDLDQLLIPCTYVLHLCTIPLRIGAERSFRRGVHTINRELREQYPLADAFYSAK